MAPIALVLGSLSSIPMGKPPRPAHTPRSEAPAHRKEGRGWGRGVVASIPDSPAQWLGGEGIMLSPGPLGCECGGGGGS